MTHALYVLFFGTKLESVHGINDGLWSMVVSLHATVGYLKTRTQPLTSSSFFGIHTWLIWSTPCQWNFELIQITVRIFDNVLIPPLNHGPSPVLLEWFGRVCWSPPLQTGAYSGSPARHCGRGSLSSQGFVKKSDPVIRNDEKTCNSAKLSDASDVFVRNFNRVSPAGDMLAASKMALESPAAHLG